jgi:4-amino-4-deoxy-L-arabinose transferase-like glycosyltransferase
MPKFSSSGDPETARITLKSSSFDHRLGLWMISNYRTCLLFVMALTAFNVFWHLSTTAISSMDEARYGVAASEMLSTHEHLVPTYGGHTEYWNLKSPLGYWLIEASFALFGRTPWALRVVSAVCALIVVALTMNFCSRRFGRRAAVLAGLMVGTCFGFLSNHGARSGDLDAALTLIVTLALMQLPWLRDSPRRRILFGALWACGFLLKSFAILPFTLVAMIYLAWNRRERLSWRDWVPAAAVFVGIVGGWVITRSIHDGTTAYVPTRCRVMPVRCWWIALRHGPYFFCSAGL